MVIVDFDSILERATDYDDGGRMVVSIILLIYLFLF